MKRNPRVLARYEDFGSVTCCEHGCLHVQLGHAVMTLTESQFMRFVAMMSDSAANLEFFRSGADRADDENG